MCTAISLKNSKHYFGRTLDLEKSFGEEVIITPRCFNLEFRHEKSEKTHHAIIGCGIACDNYPLYYEAANEKGLAIAGLNFPFHTEYSENKEKRLNSVASFEVIPFLLSKCESASEAAELMRNTSVTAEPFNKETPTSPLHWMISDKNQSFTLEVVNRENRIYENKIGVLTNEPPFEMQLFNLYGYMNLSPREAKNNFSKDVDFKVYSKGMGAIGLPGDLSSTSRFVRAAFHKLNSVSPSDEASCVNQFFHILNSVEQPRGSNINRGEYEITQYASCINTDDGIYYYTTYENAQITKIDMRKENIQKSELIRYPFRYEGEIYEEN